MIDQDGAPTIGAKGVSFEHRIAIAALATAAAVLVLACGLFLFQQWRAQEEDIAHALDVMTQVMAVEVAPQVDRGDLAGAKTSLAALKAVPAWRKAEILSPSGVMLAAVPAAGEDGPATAAETIREPLVVAGRTVGVLDITFQPPSFTRFLPRYLAVCAALFFAAAAIALILGRALARRVIHPVNRLSRTMREVTDSGDYSQRAPDWARDEFGVLTDSFNTLLVQLQANDHALHRAMSDLVEARDAAQATNILKSQFLANMSHEIRTPLNGVLAMAQIMEMGELAPDQRGRVEVIRRSGEELMGVLSDILDLSRIEASMMTLEDAPLDVADLKARLIQIHGPAAAAKTGVDFQVELSDTAGGLRRGDPARVTQILNMLISNALKFTAEGEVRVTIDGLGVEGRDGLKLVVRDTGVGIAEATLPLLFQKFSQADGSATRRYGGAGLGLAICRGLVRLMGGRIDVGSVEGKGSTFTVLLPLAVVDPAMPDARAGEPDRVLRVLAAEDIPTNQLVLRTILQAFGVDLVMVDNGRKAVDAWREGEFDLILMDIQMPIMDGVQATRAIRAEEELTHRARTPIVAVSANVMPHHAVSYLAAGMDAHVPKPIALDSLHAAIKAVLGERAEGALLSERD